MRDETPRYIWGGGHVNRILVGGAHPTCCLSIVSGSKRDVEPRFSMTEKKRFSGEDQG